MSWMGLIWDLKTVPISVRDHSSRRLDAPRRNGHAPGSC